MKGRKYRYILVPALGSLLPFAFISAGSLKSTSSAFLITNKLLSGSDSNFNRSYIDNRFSQIDEFKSGVYKKREKQTFTYKWNFLLPDSPYLVGVDQFDWPRGTNIKYNVFGKEFQFPASGTKYFHNPPRIILNPSVRGGGKQHGAIGLAYPYSRSLTSEAKNFFWWDQGYIEGNIKPYPDYYYVYPTIEISGIEEKINNLVNPKIKTNCEREGFSSISCDYSPNPNAFQNIEIVGFDLTEESKNKLKNYERPWEKTDFYKSHKILNTIRSYWAYTANPEVEVTLEYDSTKNEYYDLSDSIKFKDLNTIFNGLKKAYSESASIVNNGKITIDSDVMGDLDESLPVDIDSKKFPLKTNVQKLKEKTSTKEYSLSDGWKIKLSETPEVVSSKEKTAKIVKRLVSVSKNGSDKTAELIKTLENASNPATKAQSYNINKFANMLKELGSGINTYDELEVNLTESNLYKEYKNAKDKTDRKEQGLNLRDNLTIKYGYSQAIKTLKEWANYYNKERKLDFWQQTEAKQIKKPDKKNKYDHGTLLVGSPIDIKFISDNAETDIMLINKQKVDVLNKEFKKKLIDFRVVANTKEIKDKEKEKQPTNEYEIHLKRFKTGSNNSGDIDEQYIVKYQIIQKFFTQIIKWYAWDPDKNPDQKQLISKILLDKKGQPLLDDKKKEIPNPNYDPFIDPATGTKKEILWISNDNLKNHGLDDKLHFTYPSLLYDIKQKVDFGIYVDSHVLGKGALRNLEYDKALTNVKYYKKKLFNKKTEHKNGEKVVTYVKSDTLPEPLPLKNNNSEFSYFSDEGIWLVYATNNSQDIPTFSNASLVLIDEDNNPKSYFYETVKDRLYDERGAKLENYFQPFLHSNNWISEPLAKYLTATTGLTFAELAKMPYNDFIYKYLDFINLKYDLKKYFPDIDSKDTTYENIFETAVHWNELPNLNGLTYATEQDETVKEKYRKEVENIVTNYIKSHIRGNTRLKEHNIYENSGWEIKEWSSHDKKYWLDSALKVEKNDASKSQGVEFTLVPTNPKYKKFSFKKFYLKNNAHHIYYPPIDLSKLPIETRHTINIDYSKGTHKQNAEKISRFIKSKIYDEFQKYNQSKTTPIEIGKDVKISNLYELNIKTSQYDKFNTFTVIITPLNANLHNQIVFEFQNISDPKKKPKKSDPDKKPDGDNNPGNSSSGFDENNPNGGRSNFDPNNPGTWPSGFDANDPKTWPSGYNPNDPSTWP
ncbi:Mbov_0399 family ICE element protein, partial [Mycoplasmopsis agalactiae]